MDDDETAPDTKLPQDARLESLDRRLDQLQQEEVGKATKAANAAGDPNMRAAQLVIGYLIGGPLGGGLLGWGLDSVFGTKPWLTLAMLFLGFGVGIRNVLRVSKSQGGSSGGVR